MRLNTLIGLLKDLETTLGGDAQVVMMSDAEGNRAFNVELVQYMKDGSKAILIPGHRNIISELD
jgi:hypothetical protein